MVRGVVESCCKVDRGRSYGMTFRHEQRCQETTQGRPTKRGTKPRNPLPGRLPVPRELLTAGIELDADMEIERQQRLEALKAQLAKMFAEGRGSEALDQVMVSMASLERENERLAWRVLRANRYRFGRSTEKLSRDELKQLFLALGGQDAQVASDGSAELAVPAPDEPEQADSATAGCRSQRPTPGATRSASASACAR